MTFWARTGGAFTMESPRTHGMGGLCPFTQFGHGYGLLALDLVREYQVFAFAMLAQAQTPGTWTAAVRTTNRACRSCTWSISTDIYLHHALFLSKLRMDHARAGVHGA